MVLINNLPIKERVKLHYLIRGVQTASSGMEEYQRFSGGWVCPICGGTHLQCNRKRKNETQKFIRKDCGMTFSNKMSTIFFGTRKTLYVWREYMNCLAEGLTIDQSAERCGITHYFIIHMEEKSVLGVIVAVFVRRPHAHHTFYPATRQLHQTALACNRWKNLAPQCTLFQRIYS